MSKLTIAIIEDEIPAARLLSTMISRLRPQWTIKVLPGNVEECVDWFSGNDHPQIIFLDIQLSDGVSFDFITRAQPKSIIIFTTAYDKYAVKAFGVNSIDYILKPFDEKRLLEAIVKYETLTISTINDYNERLNCTIDTLQSREKQYRTRFLISGVDKLWTLQVADIAYLYSENRVTFAVTKNGTEHIVDLSLEKLAEQLDPDLFFKANRQIILNIDAIKQIEPYFNGRVVVLVKPNFKDKITISREKISEFKMWLNY